MEVTGKNNMNKGAQYFINIGKLAYVCGLPNIWVEDTPRTRFGRLFDLYKFISNIIIILFIVMEWGAFFTQNNLSQKKSSDLTLFGLSHPFLFTFILNIHYYKDHIRCLLFNLVMELKQTYNNEEVEIHMIRSMKLYSAAFSTFFMMALFFYGSDALIQVIRQGETFTTVVTFWPDIDDKTTLANVARITIYLVWWIFMLRMCVSYVLVISVTICLSHQFKNLQSYFHKLNDIFKENLSQEQMESKYEEAFKIGVKLHSHTLWCVKQCQLSFNVIFSSQVVLNIQVLVLNMSQMVNSERTLMNTFTILFTGTAILISTGLFMLNCGDITVEAAELSTVIYMSGWHNCHMSETRMRHLVVSTLRQTQQMEMLWALGVVPLSYESFLKIVKSSYSVFSVFY